MFSDEEKKLLEVVPEILSAEFVHVPQPDGTVQLKRYLDLTADEHKAHIHWLQEIVKRADPKELEWVANFYDDSKLPDRTV